MATDLGRVQSAPSKYDAFIAAQLTKAETRIRLLDMTAALLGFAALVLAYIVIVVLCDSKLELSQHARKLSLYAFLAGSGIYLFFTIVRPLRLRVNPYYAARQVERQLPEAKNSIVNWVDLHGQPLAPAIRGALGHRAAKDLSGVDLDRAISGRRAAWTGGLAAFFFVAFIAAFFLLGPSPFASLLKRAFNPFEQVGVSTRTRLTLLKPEGGDATITVGRGVVFVVEVGGKVPDVKAADAVKLCYRYAEDDPWLERLLTPETGREWSTSLSAIEIKNGLWYKITGGDAATEEHRIRVRAAAAVTDFLATYRYRPYVARAEEVRRERELKALRGTEVSLRVHTNRAVREGQLEFEGKGSTKIVPGEIVGDDPQTFRLRFVLDEDGKYRLRFRSADGEAYSDFNAYAVTTIADEPPTAELTKPGKDVRLPINGLLRLQGKVGDDIGVKSVLLRMRVVGGDELHGQPYRSDDKIRLADGGYPRQLEYEDFVELSRVRGADDQTFPLRAGMELEYWLEARDACDYPQANPAGVSKHFRVQLTEPEKNDAKQQQEKKQAQQDKKQHEDKQDKQLQQENQNRSQDRQDQQARNKEEQDKNNPQNEGQKEKGKSKGQDNQKNGQSNDAKNQDNKGQGDNGQQNNAEENQGENGQQDDAKKGQDEKKDGLSKENQKIEEQIKKALEKQKENESGKGDSGQSANGKRDGDKGKNDGSGDKEERQGAGQSKDDDGGNAKSKPKDGGEKKEGDKSAAKKGDSSPKKESSSGESKLDSGDKKDSKFPKKGEPDAKAEKRDATAKDVEELAKALKSDDPQRREEAKQKLEQIAKQAGDPQTRAQAEKTLKQTRQPNDSATDAANGDKKTDKSDSKKRGQNGERGGAGDPNQDKKNKNESSKNEANKKGSQGDSSSGNKGKANNGGKGGDSAGGGQRRDGAEEGQRGKNAEAQSLATKPSKPGSHRATQMQLEDFAKKVDKKILKDAGVSEEAWKKYLQARRKQIAAPEKSRPETPTPPRQANKLPSMGGHTITSPSAKADDVHGADRGQPPPAYRDSFREFTRKMSKGK